MSNVSNYIYALTRHLPDRFEQGAAKAPQTHELNPAEGVEKMSVTAKRGDTIELTLPTALTGGYTWSAQYDRPLGKPETSSGPTSSMIGGRGATTFKFNLNDPGLRNGDALVARFAHAQAWAPDDVADRFELNVKIGA
jgi:hypothetical protein